MSLAREHGITGVSMRAVARQLGVPPMTIYGYVPSKDALDTLLIDRILSDVRVPPNDQGPWEERLRTLLCDARRVLVERPQLTEHPTSLRSSAVELLHRGAFGHEASRLTAAVYDLLREGGFTPDRIDVCFIALFTYVTGYADPADAAPSPHRPAAAFEHGLIALIEGLKLTVVSSDQA